MLSFIVVLLFSPAPVPASKEDKPTGPSPVIVSAQVDKEGRLVCFVDSIEYRPETRTAQVNVAGKLEQRNYTVMVPVMTKSRTHSLDKATIAQVGGGKVDRKELAKLLEKPTLVVMSADGKPVDPAYLKVLRKNTLVIVVPSAASAMKPAGLLMPAGPIPPRPVAPPQAKEAPVNPKN
jgi:hypothetical protein